MLREVDAQLVEARLRLRALRAREIELRDRRLIARLVVVERLLGQQLPLEEVARALDVGLRQLQIRFALADRGRDTSCAGFGLLDLFDDLEVLDLGDALAAGHAIAEPHGDVLQASGGARRDRHRGLADQVADDADLPGASTRGWRWRVPRSSGRVPPPPPPRNPPPPPPKPPPTAAAKSPAAAAAAAAAPTASAPGPAASVAEPLRELL